MWSRWLRWSGTTKRRCWRRWKLDAMCCARSPMAHTLARVERMVVAAKRARRTLGVNFNYRSVPSHGLSS